MRRSFTLRMVLVALLMTLTRYSVATPAPEPTTGGMGSMTVADLEKAGDAAKQQKDYVQAIKHFQAALRKDKNNARLYNKLGLAELQNNDMRNARLDFERAAKRDPQSADAVNNLGAVYYFNKKYGSATKYFKKAVALEETRGTFHVNLGAAWFGQGKMDRALTEYTRALELDPDVFQQNNRAGIAAQIPTLEERAKYSYMLAKIYARRGDVDNCLQCLRRAKEEGYHNLAAVYKEEDFSKVWQDSRLHEVVPPPTPAPK